MNYPTSKIIATKTWYPEMLEHIRKTWHKDYDWPAYIKLVGSLNKILAQVREDGHANPAMFFCKTCNEHHESKFSGVSVPALLYALIKYGFMDETTGKKLLNKWKTYRKNNDLDVKGIQIIAVSCTHINE